MNLTKNTAQAISDLRGYDLTKTDLQLIKSDLISLGKVAVVMYTINKGRSIYRARHQPANRIYTHPTALSYRRDVENIGIGRANPEKFPVFYGAISSAEVEQGYIFSTYETSHLTRTNTNGIDTLTMSKWVVKEDFEVVAIVTSPLYHDRFKLSKDMNADHENFIASGFLDSTEDQKLIAEFLGNQFSQPVVAGQDHLYKITSELALKYYELGCKGIAYPSVQGNYQGFNVALLPGVVEKYLQFDAAILAQMRKQGDNISLHQYQIAEGFNGVELQWHLLHPEYSIYTPFENY